MAAVASVVRADSVEADLPAPVDNVEQVFDSSGSHNARPAHASSGRHIFNRLLRPEFADDELSGHGQSERPIRRLSRDFQYDLHQFLRWLRSKFFRLE